MIYVLVECWFLMQDIWGIYQAGRLKIKEVGVTMKPFTNAFEAIKKLWNSMFKSKKKEAEEEEARRKAEEEAAAAEEARKKAEEEEAKRKAEEEKLKAEVEKLEKEKKAAEKKKAERAERARKSTKKSSNAATIDPVTGEEIKLTELPKEAFRLQKYMKLPTTSKDIKLAISAIQNHPEMSRNLVILGHNGFGTLKVGEDFARTFFDVGIVKSEKIAKIKARQLNKTSLDKLKGLKGGCLIIENAGLVAFPKLVEVINNSAKDANDYVVILTGEIDSLAKFFDSNRDVADDFIYLVDVHKIREKGMIALARGYFEEKGYTADEDVFGKFPDVLKGIEVGNIDRFIDFIDGLFKKCDEREKLDGKSGTKKVTVDDFK